MPGACCKTKGHKKHTPITTEAERGFFGAELRWARKGQARRAPSLSEAEMVRHLHEAKGKKLPARRGAGTALMQGRSARR